MRKTVHIKSLIEAANWNLMVTPDEMVAERLGIASFLENQLHGAGVYRGFQYISQHDRDHFSDANPNLVRDVRGLSLGIIRPNGPDTQPILFPDDSRRRYIYDARL